MWGCPGTVSHLFIDTWFMACFFLQPLHQHTSHWSWCCFTRSKMFEWKVPCFGARFLNLLPQPAKRSERFISFIAEKQRVVAQYMRKLIPNITVLKMPFAFPQMNLCFASHSSIHLRFFFFASTTTTTWSTEVQPQKQDSHWVVWPVVHPHGHTQAWQEPAIYDVLPAAFLSSKIYGGCAGQKPKDVEFL